MFADVFFDNMVLVHAERNKVYIDKKSVNIPIFDFECIDANQEFTGNIIKIDSRKRNCLKEKYQNFKFYDDLIESIIFFNFIFYILAKGIKMISNKIIINCIHNCSF